jgi:hypothetical protein
MTANFFYNHDHDVIDKWDHYFAIYDHHFKRFLEKDDTIYILEIGMGTGASIEMWLDYFGKEKCFIYAIDINPECKKIEELHDNVKVFIGDQEDKNFLMSVCEEIERPSVIIDDGGHRCIQQINSFEVFYNHLKENGLYLCEDVHTSYCAEYGGGYKKSDTFIEYMKNYIDKLNAFFSQEPALQIDGYTKTMNSIHFYDSVVIVEKYNGERMRPRRVIKGNNSFITY